MAISRTLRSPIRDNTRESLHGADSCAHRAKEHIYVHLHVNRIGFKGKANNDNFIGKRSQQMT
ncbi:MULTISPECIES: hypothetical protein [Flavobacteriaceae]|uniref:Uncharacterized protein n=1 Tax=Flagellimonas pelagia TaxID=2306998 RepID=A0A3A1NHW5_9FLAO|nr:MULTISPECIES: hypothetical protein [Allomuricauda]RIV44295.1 hypothetical protein D2V05_12530 [Allomuricauda maritima]TXJ94210.1 hypothetical protein FQ017_12415 [Allomuricauda maritima]